MFIVSFESMFWLIAITATLSSITSITTAWALPTSAENQFVIPAGPETFESPRVVTPHLCPDNTTQYSGYLPGSSLFFWFFPSRSNPSTDPIGIWSNGGPGSSALTGMQYAGPCEVVEDGRGGYEMKSREWSLNQEASILMVDNPLGAGFSFAPFPVVHSIYDSAKDLYEFLQSFLDEFPEYASNPLAINSLSYGGHYAPAYSSYIQHMNAKLAGRDSLWEDIWPLSPAETADLRLGNRPNKNHSQILNLTSISIGNGWINSRVQYRTLVDFACGGAAERDVPVLADAQECKWALKRVVEGEGLMDECTSLAACVAAGIYTEQAAAFPYTETGRNPYDYRKKTAYDESAVIAFYGNATVQAQLGVIVSPADVPKRWKAHSSRVHMEYVYSGDWEAHTDVLFERLLRSGVSVLKYEGMVDWICNYLGIRQIMSNLPSFKHQVAFNNLSMVDWFPQASDKSAQHGVGAYKCLLGDDDGLQEGNLCYLEMEGAGHIASLDKPMETSLMLSRWMHDLKL